jgi:hypothetical protein
MRRTFLSPSRLTLQDQSLQLSVERKLGVCCVNLRVALGRNRHKTDFGEPFELALHIARVLFDHFGEAAHVHPKVGILRVYDDDFAPGFGRYEKIKHWFLFNFGHMFLTTPRALLNSPYGKRKHNASVFYNIGISDVFQITESARV